MMKMIILIFLSSIFAKAQTTPSGPQGTLSEPPTNVAAQNSIGTLSESDVSSAGKLSGRLLERGKRIPLKGFTVFLLPDRLQATTDAKGNFSIAIPTLKPTGENDEPRKLVVIASGFVRLETDLSSMMTPEVREIKIGDVYLERIQGQTALRFEVIDSNIKRDQSRKALNREEVFNAPGANGDPVKALQNLAGINRAQGFSSQVIIQGSAPKDTAYDFEGHEIPIVFHFGGLTSVVMPEAVDQVEYFSAGYQADRSRAIGGIISLRTRKPEVTERDSKAFFYLDNLSAGGLYERKINDSSSFLVSGRASYVGFFLKNALKDEESLNLTVAPEFIDFTSVYHNQLSDSEDFKLSFVGSKDRLAFVLNEPLRQDPSLRGNFSNEIQFFRFVPSYKKKLDPQNDILLSLALGQDKIGVDIGDRFFSVDSSVLSTRGEWDHKVSDVWSFQSGWDNQYSNAKVKLKLPLQRSVGGVSNPISSGELVDVDVKAKVSNLGLYFRSQHELSPKMQLVPGIRLDRFSQTQELFILPRLAASYKQSDYQTWKFGYGIYTQNPEPQEVNEDVGNPDIKSPMASQIGINYEHDFRKGDVNGWNSQFGFFYRDFNRLIIQSSKTVVRDGATVFEIYNNDGKGKALGTETSLAFQKDEWKAKLAYTLSQSRRSDPDTAEYNFEFDQTHNINLIGSYEFGNNWKVSSRYRYVTGNPDTPIIGSVFDADNETYFPVRGPIYSVRNKPFNQLDLRLDKKIISDREIWTFYLDIQNVLNIKNSEGVQYSYDYSIKQDVMGLPVIPAIGVRGEF